MGSNLAKTPLMAILYASLIYFAEPAMPRSEAFSAATAGFHAPLLGHGFLLLFALWVSIALAIGFAASPKAGAGALLPVLATVLGAVWALPALKALVFGEATGIMSRTDSLFSLLWNLGATIVIGILALLLFGTAEPPKQAPNGAKTVYKLRTVHLVVKLLVLPVAFGLLHYLAWYFIVWRNPYSRVFYGGGEGAQSFTQVLVDMLLEHAVMIPFALGVGLLYNLLLLPVLFLMPASRGAFICFSAVACTAGAFWLLVPSPVLPSNVAATEFLFRLALMAVYGILAGWLLHTSYLKEVIKPKAPVQEKPQAGGMQARHAAAALRTTMNGGGRR